MAKHNNTIEPDQSQPTLIDLLKLETKSAPLDPWKLETKPDWRRSERGEKACRDRDATASAKEPTVSVWTTDKMPRSAVRWWLFRPPARASKSKAPFGPQMAPSLTATLGQQEEFTAKWSAFQPLLSTISSTGKVSYRRARDLGSNPAYTKNQLMSWPDGLAFRGHDESEDSSNQGNFLELLRFLADHNEDIKAVTLRNAPENNMMISPTIQKDIVSAAAVKTSNAIIMELGDAFFSVLIDESRDISTKEQMAVALRYVDKKGHVVERFLGIEHVTDTTALSLKAAVEDLFCRHGLSLSRLRGQGYDGASNMQGQFNGLKTLIMKENESTYYVHCFAHQLQLALVAMAKNNNKITTFFNFVANVVNIAGGSCKRLDLLKEKQATRVVESVHNGELPSGQGLNQETSLKRSCDTRWSSHYNTMISLIDMFPSIVDVLDAVAEDGATSRAERTSRTSLTLYPIFWICV
uniref:DUF4371 domain-containing protein n=1 Tax=Fagus sylvatica TaxID=28930 RepID=A0A2N9GDV8_FAGSY